METYRNFINGEWVESRSTRTAPNFNPADPRDVIGTVRLSTVEEVRAAVEAAEKAFPKWRAVPAPERGRVIDRAKTILARRKEEVARALTHEEGKLLKESLGEVQKSINVLEFMAGEAMRLTGETSPSELSNTLCYTVRQPIGVVAAITPWNFPVAIPCWKIAPALLTGCTVVFKPSTLTPLTAKMVVEVFQEAGAPPGTLNLVYGAGGEAGRVLVEHPSVCAISFTGSNEVGLKLYHDGAAVAKKIQCEMGGKNPVVVLEDADLDLAADGIAQGAFGSTGQRCTATSRVVVMEAVADRLLDLVAAKARAMKPGVDLGPVVDENQLKTVLGYIAAAKEEGAKLVVGGDRAPGAGFFVQPTIFDQVTSRMRIAQEEVFGPVLAFLRVKSFEEALEVANGVKYGLTSSIYSNDPGRIFRFVEAIETGITHVNSPTMGGEPQLPFGGMKATGLGTREMGRTAMEFYTELKTVYFDYTGRRRETNIY
ncbi:MAG: aldehyde dehydrogenase family protein [Planctomycetes bacterium]|nr:aldehyde dehydrogenase family protein [Planctomycetota bacterium]